MAVAVKNYFGSYGNHDKEEVFDRSSLRSTNLDSHTFLSERYKNMQDHYNRLNESVNSWNNFNNPEDEETFSRYFESSPKEYVRTRIAKLKEIKDNAERINDNSSYREDLSKARPKGFMGFVSDLFTKSNLKKRYSMKREAQEFNKEYESSRKLVNEASKAIDEQISYIDGVMRNYEDLFHQVRLVERGKESYGNDPLIGNLNGPAYLKKSVGYEREIRAKKKEAAVSLKKFTGFGNDEVEELKKSLEIKKMSAKDLESKVMSPDYNSDQIETALLNDEALLRINGNMRKMTKKVNNLMKERQRLVNFKMDLEKYENRITESHKITDKYLQALFPERRNSRKEESEREFTWDGNNRRQYKYRLVN